MDFSNYKSVNLKLNALMYLLTQEHEIFFSQDFRRSWRLTNKQLQLLIDREFIKLEKRFVELTSISSVTYTYIIKGPAFKVFQPLFDNSDKMFVWRKAIEHKMEYIKRKLVPNIPEKVLLSLANSCQWSGGNITDRLYAIRYSHITGRMYYPYNRLQRAERQQISGWKYKSLDANASQLVILANDLEKDYPGNEFSKIVLNANDVYEALCPYIDEAGYRKWLVKLENGREADRRLFAELNELFADQEFDGGDLPRKAVKLMMYRVIFGGNLTMLHGFPELKEYIELIQGRYSHATAKRYEFANKSGYHFMKNLASLMSHKESKIMNDCAVALSAKAIRYQLVHDSFDIDETQIELAKTVMNTVVAKTGLKNYKFIEKTP